MHPALEEQSNETEKGPWSFMKTMNGLLDFSRNVIEPSKYGVWTGGAKDRNIDGNTQTYVSNYNSEPFTMEYIAYRYQPIIHGKHHNNDWRNWSTSYSAKARSDKENKFMDVTPSDKNYISSEPKSDKKSLLSNDSSLVWEDIYGISNYSMGDDFVDNSRYRWSGSTFYTENGKVKPLFGKWRAKWLQNNNNRTMADGNDLTSGGGYLEGEPLSDGYNNFYDHFIAFDNGDTTWTNKARVRQIGDSVNITTNAQALLESISNAGTTPVHPSAINVAVPSLENDCVGKPVSFRLYTSEKDSSVNLVTNTPDVPYRAWMTRANQNRYYDVIKFFSTKEDKTGDKTVQHKAERDERRQAPSETAQFKKTDIVGLE